MKPKMFSTPVIPTLAKLSEDDVFKNFKDALDKAPRSTTLYYWHHHLFRLRFEELNKIKTKHGKQKEQEVQEYLRKIFQCTEFVNAVRELMIDRKIKVPDMKEVPFLAQYAQKMNNQVPAIENLGAEINRQLTSIVFAAGDLAYDYLNVSQLKIDQKHQDIPFLTNTLKDLSAATATNDNGEFYLDENNIPKYVSVLTNLSEMYQDKEGERLRKREFAAKVIAYTSLTLFIAGFGGFAFPPLFFIWIPALTLIMLAAPAALNDSRFGVDHGIKDVKKTLGAIYKLITGSDLKMRNQEEKGEMRSVGRKNKIAEEVKNTKEPLLSPSLNRSSSSSE